MAFNKDGLYEEPTAKNIDIVFNKDKLDSMSLPTSSELHMNDGKDYKVDDMISEIDKFL